METAGQVDGLAGELLGVVCDPDGVTILHAQLDRYCHRLRNRLNSMKLSLYLARRLAGPNVSLDWEEAESNYRAIERMVEQLYAVSAPMEIEPAQAPLSRWIEQRAEAWREVLGRRSIGLCCEGPSDSRPGRFDPVRLGQGLDRLIEAVAEWGPPGGTLRLDWGRRGGRFWVALEGEGGGGLPWLPSVDQGRMESLAVALLGRIIGAHGGLVSFREDSAFAVDLSWPIDGPPALSPRADAEAEAETVS